MKNHPRYQDRFDPLIFAAYCEEKMEEAGGKILYHTMTAAITPENDGAAVTLCPRDGLKTFHTKRLIDCTGDAAATALAGFEVLPPVSLPAGEHLLPAFRL